MVLRAGIRLIDNRRARRRQSILETEPQRFGDKRHERMKQAQGILEHGDQGLTNFALLLSSDTSGSAS